MKELKVDSKIVRIMKKDYAYKHNILPLYFDEDYVHIAASEEKSNDVYGFCRLIFKRDVKFHKESEKDLDELLRLYYGDENLKTTNKEKLEEDIPSNIIIGNGPNIELAEYILNAAIRAYVSDIHIEPRKKDVYIRFRKDGILERFMNIPFEAYRGLLGRIKVMSNLELTEKRSFQDGKLFYEVDNREYDIRLSLAPTIYGEKLVMRILYKDESIRTLEKINYNERNLKTFKKLLDMNSGMILVTGPTGSGKSTTLYAALNYLNKNGVNIITLEDPVEYVIEGINQIDINECNSSVDFISGLRSLLRQDPDIMMIGEIRDEETAKIAVRSAITGHKVLSTIHTNNALGVINRLVDMGIEEYLLKDALKGIIGQRLVRKLCNHCKCKHVTDEEEMHFLGIKEKKYIYRSNPLGCEKCRNTGYNGRICINEVLETDKVFFDNERENYMKLNYKTMKDDLIDKILCGSTSIEEGRRNLD